MIASPGVISRVAPMSRLNTLTATEIARATRAGEVTCEAVVSDCLARIGEREQAIHAWATVDAELALRQARALDRSAARGPLHGVPIGIKDIIDTADLPTEMGSPIYARASAGDRRRLRRARARGRRGDSRQDRHLRIRRHDAGADHQSAQSRPYARRLIQRIGCCGR